MKITLDNITKEYKKNLTASNAGTLGKESEYPLVYKDNERMGEAALHEDVRNMLTRIAKENNWIPVIDDQSGLISGVSATYKDPQTGEEHGVDIGTDFGVCTLEVGYAPGRSIDWIETQAKAILDPIVEIADSLEIAVLGYGIQPLAKPDARLVADKGRAGTLESRFWTTHRLNGHNTDVHYHTINAAEHIHVGVSEEDAIPYLNAMNLVSPLIIGLLANSSVWQGEIDETYLEPREKFWEWVVNIPQDQTRRGVPEQYEDIDDYVQTIIDYEPIMTVRGVNGTKRYVEIVDMPTMRKYLESGIAKAIAPGTRNARELIQEGDVVLEHIEPDVLDMYVHDSFVWHCNRIKSGYGTVESRISGQQHPKETNVPLALVAGLYSAREELQAYVQEQGLTASDARTMREDVIRSGTNSTHANISIKLMMKNIIDIAANGLESVGEDSSRLAPLYRRVRTGITQSERAAQVYKEKGIAGLVQEYKH